MLRQPFQIIVKWDKCVGCRKCEVACSTSHHGVINPELSAIRIYEAYPGPMNIPIVCSYCSDHPCVEACPTEALSYDGKRFLFQLDTTKCTKCGLCVDACRERRSKALRLHPTLRHPIVCDLCGGEPQCVKVCDFGVLEFLPSTLIFDGKHFASPAETIAEDMAEKWYPASKEKRLNWTL